MHNRPKKFENSYKINVTKNESLLFFSMGSNWPSAVRPIKQQRLPPSK